MHAVKKLIVYLSLVFVAVVLASIYGAFHNQLSFAVSPEYFTKFKFYQFGYLDSKLPERVRASLVGIRASWWMGFPIGLLAGIAGFVHPNYKRMLRVSIQALLVALAFTFIFGVAGLLYGLWKTSNLDVSTFNDWYLPFDAEYPRSFVCAGYMHNSAYLGGILSIPVAWIYHIYAKYRTAIQ